MRANVLSYTPEIILDEFTKAMVDSKLQTFCIRRVALNAREQVTLSYSIRGASVILYEQRRSNMDPKARTRAKIARADFDEESKIWTLWVYDPHERPKRYPGLFEAIDFDMILGKINHDPKRIIWTEEASFVQPNKN